MPRAAAVGVRGAVVRVRAYGRGGGWFGTQGERWGGDGCRVPLPWESEGPSYGFGPTAASWLPQPRLWAQLARDQQTGPDDSTLTLYQRAVRIRRARNLGGGELTWVRGCGRGAVAFTNGTLTVPANTGGDPISLLPLLSG